MSDMQTFKAMCTAAGIQFEELSYDGDYMEPFKNSFSEREGTVVIHIVAEKSENVSGTSTTYYFDSQGKLYHISCWPY